MAPSNEDRDKLNADRRIKDILEAIPLASVLIGNRTQIVAMNESAKELLGERALNRHYVTTLRQPQVLECIEAVLQTGSKRQTRFQKHDVSGKGRTFALHVAPVEDAAGHPGALLSFEDVTEIETAGQMRRDFVANVSHELRTPLTALVGFIETLRGAARDDASARDRFLSIMEREAGRMNRLVHDLLSLSRVEADERRRPTEMVDLVGILNSTIATLEPLAEDQNNNINIKTYSEECIVPGDRDLLQQVFSNLIENALKYGGKGKPVDVTLYAPEHDPGLRGTGIRVEIRDHGDGIDEQHLGRLTERFYRIDNHRSREMGGTGLGLAIVKHIVNRHRGRLHISSTMGKGSCFTVALPLANERSK